MLKTPKAALLFERILLDHGDWVSKLRGLYRKGDDNELIRKTTNYIRMINTNSHFQATETEVMNAVHEIIDSIQKVEES